jgi:hypothetical protein
MSNPHNSRARVLCIALAFLLLTGCFGGTETALPLTLTPSATATPTGIPPTQTPTDTAVPSPTSTPEPLGCLKPPEEYGRVEVDGETLNQRTLAMLAHAQTLYGGELELTGHAITQGSYTSSLSASFGTHAGGGAVDLSVLKRGTYTVLWDDIGPLIRALRAAGFAAWLRVYGELHENSPIHIHAIAIGDRELSEAAQEQLTGEAGYFRGSSGLPVSMYGAPTQDRYGGPIICQWMLDLGYRDLR